MNAATHRRQAARSARIIGVLAGAFPRAIVLYERKRRPLKVGIRDDIITTCQPAIDKGFITVTDIRSALRRYTSADGYLLACRKAGLARVNLGGKIVGVVTSAEAAHARQVLKLRKAARRANAGLASTKNGPRAAGTANGPISTTRVMCNERSTPSGAGASPAV